MTDNTQTLNTQTLKSLKKLTPRRKLSLKQLKFIRAYLKTGNQTQAALQAYDTKDKNTAHVIGSENLQKPTINAEIQKAHKKMGITPDLLTQKLKEGLNAHEIKYFQHEGEVIDKRVCVDHNARRGYLEIAHKLRGDYIERKELTGPDGMPLNVGISVGDLKNCLKDYENENQKNRKK